MPIRWEFGTPSTVNQELSKICNAIVSSRLCSDTYTANRIMDWESSICVMRGRNFRQEARDEDVENNLLAMLYRYSYLMNLYPFLRKEPNRLSINWEQLMSLIKDECVRRIENLDIEMQNNPSISNLLQKYKAPPQKRKLYALSDINNREYDYVVASIMVEMLTSILQIFTSFYNSTCTHEEVSVFSSLAKYPDEEVMMMLNQYISAFVPFCLNKFYSG